MRSLSELRRPVTSSWVAVLGCLGAVALAACGGGASPLHLGDNLVTLITTDVPNATTGVPYAAQVSALFPHPPGKYMCVGGQVPPGLKLDQDTGEISGYPRQTGRFTFKISARDGMDPTIPNQRDSTFSSDERTFQVDVALGLPNILPQTLPAAQYRASYAYYVDVAGGTAPYTFARTGGTLPAGLEVAADGKIGPFPTQAQQEPFLFEVTVTDANGLQDTEQLSVQVVVLPLLILTSQFPDAAQNFPYDVTLELASAGAGAPITWRQQLPPADGEVDLADIGMEITQLGHLRAKAPAPGPTTVGDHTFTAKVTDEAAQVATRQYTLRVNPGPVLLSITPSKALQPGPFTATGLNFQPGVQLIFAPASPGPSILSTFSSQSSTTLVFPTAPNAPAGVTGYVTVRALNPDGGYYDLPAAFAYPAANLTFATRILPTPNSTLSSTGLDVADVNRDGFADILHCGTNTGSWCNGSGTSAGVDLMLNTPAGPGGTFDSSNPAFDRIALGTGADWHQAKFVDANVDGNPDVVAVGRSGGTAFVRTWINPYPAAFSAGMPFTQSTLPYEGSWPAFHVSDIAFGRLENGDSLPDLAYVNQGPAVWNSSTGYEGGGTVSTVKGLGTGAFAGTNLDSAYDLINPTLYAAAGVAVGKLNGDAVSDIVVSDQSGGHSSWYWGYGNYNMIGMVAYPGSTGVFGSWTPVTSTAPNISVVETLGVTQGDVTGDGSNDVIFSTSYDPQSGSWGGTPTLATYAGNGSGSLTELAAIKPTMRCRYVCTFDGDFDLANDLAVSGGTPGSYTSVQVYKGRSGGQNPLFKATLSALSANVGRVASGDVNGDGRPDVVVANSFFADSYTYYYNGVGLTDRGNGGTMGVSIFLNTSQ